MTAWFRSQILFHAKALVFVFDPKYVRGGFHCDACRGVYDEHIAIKYRITGRTKKQTKAAAGAAKWVAAVLRYREDVTSATAADKVRLEEKLKAAFVQLLKHASTQSVAVVAVPAAQSVAVTVAVVAFSRMVVVAPTSVVGTIVRGTAVAALRLLNG